MKRIALWLLEFYQMAVSPLLGKACRFYPSCSDYSKEAIGKYGFFYGCWLTLKRLLKCAPWHPGGCDPVP